MATTASPYGLRAVNHMGGTPYAGATRLLPIASGYGTNIYNGSIIEIVTTLGTTSGNVFPAGVIGVFVGCTYTDPNLGTVVFRQNWPTGTVASDALAYIVDDPDVIFQAQADGQVTQAELGENAHLAAVQATGTGSTTTGNSNSAIDASEIATTNTFAFRIVDFVDSPTSTVGDAFTDLLIKFNAGIHSYDNATGV